MRHRRPFDRGVLSLVSVPIGPLLDWKINITGRLEVHHLVRPVRRCAGEYRTRGLTFALFTRSSSLQARTGTPRSEEDTASPSAACAICSTLSAPSPPSPPSGGVHSNASSAPRVTHQRDPPPWFRGISRISILYPSGNSIRALSLVRPSSVLRWWFEVQRL